MAALGSGVWGVAAGEPMPAAARQHAVFDEFYLPLARIDMYERVRRCQMSWLPNASVLQPARSVRFYDLL